VAARPGIKVALSRHFWLPRGRAVTMPAALPEGVAPRLYGPLPVPGHSGAGFGDDEAGAVEDEQQDGCVVEGHGLTEGLKVRGVSGCSPASGYRNRVSRTGLMSRSG